MKNKIYLFILIFALIFSSSIFAQEMLEVPSIYYFTPRVFSMGGAYTGWAKGIDGIFYNPAAYALANNRQLSLLDPSIRINFSMLSVLNMITEAGGDYQALLQNPNFVNQLVGLRLSFGAAGIPTIGFIAGGLAIAAFDSGQITANIKKGLLVPNVYLNVGGDLGLIVGYAFKIGPIYAGVNAKFLYKIFGEENTSILNILNYNPDSGNLPIPLYKANGLSFDFGAIMKLGDLQLGIVLQDGFSRLSYWKINNLNDLNNSSVEKDGTAYIKPKLNVGVAYKVGTILPIIIYNLVLVADIQDINGFITDLSNKNYYTLGTKLYMGAEFQSFGLLTFRAGLMQGYPTFGISINLLLVKINFAYYSRELSSIPGLNQEENLLINISFIW